MIICDDGPWRGEHDTQHDNEEREKETTTRNDKKLVTMQCLLKNELESIKI